MSSMYIKWLIFTCDLLSFYPAVHFLKMWLSGIMAITYNNGDGASPWNMPFWIFTSAKLCADTRCSLEDLPGVMDDRDRWQERVREIRADDAK